MSYPTRSSCCSLVTAPDRRYGCHRFYHYLELWSLFTRCQAARAYTIYPQVYSTLSHLSFVRLFVQDLIKTTRDWNMVNSPSPSNLLKQWRHIYIEATAQVMHRSTEGSLDVTGKSRSKHLIRNHNLKEGYVNQGLEFLKALHAGWTACFLFFLFSGIQQNVPIPCPSLSFLRFIGCE